MIYRMDYDSLYLTIKGQLKRQFGIEIPDEWERGVLVYGKRDAPLPEPKSKPEESAFILLKARQNKTDAIWVMLLAILFTLWGKR